VHARDLYSQICSGMKILASEWNAKFGTARISGQHSYSRLIGYHVSDGGTAKLLAERAATLMNTAMLAGAGSD
jgi:hypothetical protein